MSSKAFCSRHPVEDTLLCCLAKISLKTKVSCTFDSDEGMSCHCANASFHQTSILRRSDHLHIATLLALRRSSALPSQSDSGGLGRGPRRAPETLLLD